MSGEIVDSPVWHEGELALQRRAGSAGRLAEFGPRIIRDRLIQQHRDFYRALPFVAIGAVDAQGEVWASLRAGRPGFLQSPDETHLRVDLKRDAADPAEAGLEDEAAVALLGIELTTRRRNRLNGRILRLDDSFFEVSVAQSYGNCPQYIHPRRLRFVRDPAAPAAAPAQRMESLDARSRALIARSDTFFVASYVDREDAGRQVDVSHRGGKPGFVRVDEAGVLTVPDYAGNQFFNTLGNILVNPRAGLVFADLASGDLLQISGGAELIVDAAGIAGFENVERIWRVRPRGVVYREGAFPLRMAGDPD